MLPYSERDQKFLVEQLCTDILSSAVPRHAPVEESTDSEKPNYLQMLFDLEFEMKFRTLLCKIYSRLPIL